MDIGKSLSYSKYVPRRGLALTLGHDPMLDPEILAGMGVRPPCDIAGGKDPRHAGFEVFVHSDTPVGLNPSSFGELNPWAHADTDDHEIRCQRCTAPESL